MSRETDTSSSGPQGRGNTSYPSGTHPYGEPAVENSGADPEGESAEPAERRTETTMTTRIRINIPGSRPIPPVVVRTPVSGDDPPSGASDPSRTSGTPGPSGEPGPEAETSAPQSPVHGNAPQSPVRGNAPLPVRPKQTRGKQSGADGAKPAGAAGSEPPTGGGWFAPRKPVRQQTPQTGGDGEDPTGGLRLPGEDNDATGGQRLPRGQATSGLHLLDGDSGPRPGDSGGFPTGSGIPGAESDFTRGASTMSPFGPADGDGPAPTARYGPGPAGGGHAGGESPIGGGPGDGSPFGGGPGDTAGFPVVQDSGSFAAPRSEFSGTDLGREGFPYFTPEPGPTGVTGGPAFGDGPLSAGEHAGGVPRLSDDTAVLTPQQIAAGGRLDGNVSGSTLTSGIPVIPSGAGGPGPTESAGSRSAAQEPKPAAATAKPKKKGRNKLVLLGVCAGGVFGVAYGAGLLLNHSDVPSGTTVVGVDIGGGTRDEAVKKLDAELADRAGKPLKLSVDGDTVELRPDQAGLAMDTAATVREASGSDYNPVSVIGSLFGGGRTVEPVMPVDEEKLRAALERAAGGAGSATEGGIKFEPGKAIAVKGKSGKGVDAVAGAKAVEEAYRKQIETASAGIVKLPTTERNPAVSDAEVDRMMKDFAEPAMSGLITVQTDAAHSISFSPERSLYKFLKVVPVEGGKLSEKYDLKILKGLYGNAFDGVLIEKAQGGPKPVGPADVARAVGEAIRGKTPAERVVTIDTNPT